MNKYAWRTEYIFFDIYVIQILTAYDQKLITFQYIKQNFTEIIES